MSRVITTYGVGSPLAGEKQVLYLPKEWDGTGSYKACIMAHGYGGGADLFMSAFRTGPEHLAAAHIPTFAADLGGDATWGNNASTAAMDLAFNYLTAQPGINASEVFVFGGSMGALVALNWAWRNPTKVAGAALMIPAVNLVDLHDNRYLDPPTNSMPLAPLIEPAFVSEGGYASAVSSHDPAQNTAAIISGSFPVKLFYSSNDGIIIPSVVTNFGTAISAQVENIGALGHTDAGYNYDHVVEFFGPYV